MSFFELEESPILHAFIVYRHLKWEIIKIKHQTLITTYIISFHLSELR